MIDYKTMTVKTLVDNVNNNSIEVAPDFQREAVWNKVMKEKLIDSILNGYPISTITLTDDPIQLAVDGRQRLTALTEYVANVFGVQAGKFRDLADNVRKRVLDYKVSITVVSGIDDVSHVFTALQTGKPLNAAEIRNSSSSNMRELVDALSKHKLFSIANISKTARNRLKHKNVVEQIICTELKDEATAITKNAIDQMYADHNDIDVDQWTKTLTKRFDDMVEAFGNCRTLNSVNLVFVAHIFTHATAIQHTSIAEFITDVEAGLTLAKKTRAPKTWERNYIATLSGAGSAKGMVTRFKLLVSRMKKEGIQVS